ncbi:hypothetical protein GAMM_330005 [Gammaproteobacteria bacterium]
MADVMSGIGVNLAGVWGTVGKVATVTFWGLLAIGVIYIIVYFLKFKYPLYLLMQEGNTVRFKKDRGFMDKKKMKFQALKNKNVTFNYPESKYFMTEGKRPILFAFVRNESATFLEVSANPHFIPADMNMLNKMINDFDATWNIVKPKQNFWDKWGQQLLWIGSLGIFLIVIILILKRMDAIIALGNNVATAQAAAGKQVIG